MDKFMQCRKIASRAYQRYYYKQKCLITFDYAEYAIIEFQK